jgi:hypothetical protein
VSNDYPIAMGLDFSTEGIPYVEDLGFDERAHWSYSGFDRFRRRLARSCGFTEDLETLWQQQPDHFRFHILWQLLNHSDCDGTLSPIACRILFKELTVAVWDWKPVDDYDRINALKLAHHMLECARQERHLVFR